MPSNSATTQNPLEMLGRFETLIAHRPFDRTTFPLDLLGAFGASEATLDRLRKGDRSRNLSDLGGVLLKQNCHISICDPGGVTPAMQALRDSPATTRHKVQMLIAADGAEMQAEDLSSGQTVASPLADAARHFGFLLPLAGVRPPRELADNILDLRATRQLNQLYVELMRHNEGWDTKDHQKAMNRFMARLIFCFFAERTGIFNRTQMFTKTVQQMCADSPENMHGVMATLFTAMNTPAERRRSAHLPAWADQFPYVNGGLFAGELRCPPFSAQAGTYFKHAAGLDWRQVNPDIFGSMIQTITDDQRRGESGVHYTAVANIRKVLGPLFLDQLQAQLAAAETDKKKLQKLRTRLARLRVLDPACGSGNFLVVAYRELRAMEACINERLGQARRSSEISPQNFRGIEIADFPAEIARLALIISRFQCDDRYVGRQEAVDALLPLDDRNWVVRGNALQLDWRDVFPPPGQRKVGMLRHNMVDGEMAGDLRHGVDFAHTQGETFICGNPPFRGNAWQTDEQKSDMKRVFDGDVGKSLDYVAAWFMKAAEYIDHTESVRGG